MPFVPKPQPKCPKCGGSVYQAELMLAGGESWHKGCFKCNMCNKALDSTNCTEHAYPDGKKELYCKSCYGRKFGPKGIGHGVGAGCMSTETGAQFQQQ